MQVVGAPVDVLLAGVCWRVAVRGTIGSLVRMCGRDDLGESIHRMHMPYIPIPLVPHVEICNLSSDVCGVVSLVQCCSGMPCMAIDGGLNGCEWMV